MPQNTTYKNPAYKGSASNKALGAFLIIIAVFVSAYTSVYVWIQKRTFFEKLTYKPVTEQVALERSYTMRTVLPTELYVVSGSDESKINVPAGTEVRCFGTYMRMLNYRQDSYSECSPLYYSPDQFFFIELPDGTRGAAQLPETLIGKKIVVDSGETLTVSGIRKKGEGRYPYEFLVNGNSQTYQWGDFECLNEAEETVVYTCPLNGVPEGKRHKVARVPRFYKIPTHSDDGFFLFPRFKQWNMYRIGPWWRGGFMLTVYWLVLLVIVLWRIGALSVRLSVKADRKFIKDASHSNKEVYTNIVHYYWPRYFIPVFIVGCIFSPLVWLWTKIYRKSIMEVLHKELESERCPKCGQLGLKKEYTGKETPERFLRTVHTEAHTATERKNDYSEKVYDPDLDKERYRQWITTTTYAAGSHDVYVHEREYVVCCEKCHAIIQRGQEQVSRTCNYKGGEVLSERTTKEAVKKIP